MLPWRSRPADSSCTLLQPSRRRSSPLLRTLVELCNQVGAILQTSVFANRITRRPPLACVANTARSVPHPPQSSRYTQTPVRRLLAVGPLRRVQHCGSRVSWEPHCAAHKESRPHGGSPRPPRTRSWLNLVCREAVDLPHAVTENAHLLEEDHILRS
jgi:hypothetical protein